MKLYLSIIAMTILTSFSTAHGQNEKTKTITFITTAICEDCKERIEDKLNYTKGVIFAELNLENKMLTVKYKTALITEQQIKEILASIGYSSDTVVRDKDAYLALPKCCKGESTCEPEK
ncbi:MAG: heavy-metal-associated domain-containing protein [Crocinitomicaceae bacterium]|nr:heavy-metal-associated domain-containing protein [Crocinitomicaceae bacterium]